MATFKYLAKQPMRFTLKGNKEFSLHEGNEVELPEENAHIVSLEAQGYIKRVEKQVINEKKDK